MTTEQQRIYREMKLLRIARNTEGSDRDAIDKQFESLRKQLGGMQYAVCAAAKVNTNTDLSSDKHRMHMLALFVECPTCKRMLHYSVVGKECYSCSTVKSANDADSQ